MRKICVSDITDAVEKAFIQANINVTKTSEHLCSIKHKEKSEIARGIFDDLILNAKIAKEKHMPYCQDTGMAVVFADIGQDIHVFGGDITHAINRGVRKAYTNFRKSVVDPITRENTKYNTPAMIYYDMVRGENIEITVLPKGFGSENMSSIAMMTPDAGILGIENFVVEVVRRNGAQACPPLVIGVGIGGTFEKCAMISKKALCRDIGESSHDEVLRDMEARLLDKINALGIGAMGLGGDITALGVNIEKEYTHMAGLPVAVNIMCHAFRHEKVVL